MRPASLFPLFANVQTLPGVGGKTAGHLARIGITQIIDFLWHAPVSLVDRRHMPALNEAKGGEIITAIVTVESHHPPERNGLPYRIRCFNDTGYIHLVFFNTFGNYLERQMPVGSTRVISGRVESFNYELQMTHPDYMTPESELETVKRVEPVYPLTGGVTHKQMTKYLSHCLKKAPQLPEWITTETLAQESWSDWHTAILAIHQLESEASLLPQHKDRRRLAYDELLANQLALQISRQTMKKEAGRSLKGNGTLSKQVREALPFSLTDGQQQVINDIAGDQASDFKMFRLLQGDVGSGKTAVALFAMLNVVECGKQALLMAPTEILAQQHYAWISETLANTDIKVALLTGKQKGKEREALLEEFVSGETHIVIGTHALFQENVTFHDVGLVVIDEQHRFGVNQRLALAEKGSQADLLLMTATPIPRTLTLVTYGDMDVSSLTEKPKGRQEIDTRVMSVSKLDSMLEGIKRAVDQGEKAYWICPLIQESESSDLAAVEERFANFQQILGPKVGLAHGKMKAEERDAVMQKFKSGEISVLVATTVVEVGVDVPDATIIVIEHAERFGLSQLHQLRGRVGRGDKASNCLLLYGPESGKMTQERLRVMRESTDGFYIAEEDLRLRGSGELLGTKQSGLPDFRIVDVIEHRDLFKKAHEDARAILEADPQLTGERSEALKTLLYLYQYDQHMQYLKAA